MKGENRKRVVVLGPGEGRKVVARPTGGGATMKVGADESEGTVSIFEGLQPAGDLAAPPLHRHAFDESFYVLEGDYLFKVDDRLLTGTVGSFVYVPGGTIHAFRRIGRGAGRMLTICHPGGIEEVFAAGSPEEKQAMDMKYGAEYLGPPLDLPSP
jgi:mannose-6-phosphate isomerase-like protein (cupin superfamily)